jgi:transcriptional regulator with XRE-family HTH domain
MQAMVYIGNNLKRARLRRAMSQRNLAEASGVSQKSITDIENGKREPYPSTVRKLATALGVDPAVLVGELEDL